MSYISLTDDDRKRMLRTIGASSVDDLFADIPPQIRLQTALDLPESLSEIEFDSLLSEIEARNRSLRSFAGAGAYQHYIPPVVDQLAGRSEFYTSYTPYQAEVSQGTLAAIFEFQTMICRLTGMDVANASMYDGATACAEAVFMAARAGRRGRVVVSRALHPHYRQVLRTYAWAAGLKLVEAGLADGATDQKSVRELIDGDTAAVVVQNPNFFGVIEDLDLLVQTAHEAGARMIAVACEPLSLALLKTPGELGADIACGEAQGFGNPAGFGGPMIGFFAAREEFLRRMPGRLVGQTRDLDNRIAYVLTLQTREQHIRREKATSNICTNQGLCALRSVIYLSCLGPRLRELAVINHRLAARLKAGLTAKGYSPVFTRPYFNEFAVRCGEGDEFAGSCADYLPGIDLGAYYEELSGCRLFCATEMTGPVLIDDFLARL